MSHMPKDARDAAIAAASVRVRTGGPYVRRARATGTDWVARICHCGHPLGDHAPGGGHCMAVAKCGCNGPLYEFPEGSA
jgi:hypothetical protein